MTQYYPMSQSHAPTVYSAAHRRRVGDEWRVELAEGLLLVISSTGHHDGDMYPTACPDTYRVFYLWF
jgi:hypothetical protein